MIFTIPHELNEIWLFNRKQMTNILFRAVRDTLFEFCLDEKHMGGKPGIVATLHSWSQTLKDHLHIHCLIAEGGLSKGGQWIVRNNGYLLPVKAVMPMFKGKMLAYVNKAVEKQEIRLPATMSRQRWTNLKNRLGRVKWNVRIQNRYEYGKGVLTYLARYIRGGAISNNRIIYDKNGEIKFRYRQGDNKQETMELPVNEFIKRYFNHVPEPYTRVVRYYGLYAPTAKEELAACREELGQEPVKEIEELDWQEYYEKRGIEGPCVCPECGRRLVRLADIPRMPIHYKKPDKQAA